MPEEIYFLFAHEPYFPPHGLREVNCTIVAAATLLHRHVRQPDGARIHRLLHTGPRTDKELVPLATLTHELEGGDGWAEVGDWEKVVADLLALTRFGSCDSLGLALPALERALVCSGPHSRVINLNPETGQRETHGPDQRAALLATLTHNLHTAQEGRQLWPGAGLLPALH
ncbi:hypothetical protein GCM10010277_69490 [Streptomyces longisporoflavus]|uniref:hypothetical protein n=1 Tax=Streptomyces longisporoflavus TaxID=28044 RepID=UPI00167DC662|nr:hypothetical protein [Streptomyces longisporoflavus]GGV63366.1 hypothetical protein GCM10010277_69490 [Streptomyces longisporoflavus]